MGVEAERQVERHLLRRPRDAVLAAVARILESKRGITVYVYPALVARFIGLPRANITLLSLIASVLDELPFARRVDDGGKHKRRYYVIDRRLYVEWVSRSPPARHGPRGGTDSCSMSRGQRHS